ncbi:MAG: DUF3833 domain-containing protein [Proteobacteria bacterium]|nr:DUF3833 domain-containing protein [Pseudomonadota bacterium]
MRTLGLMTVVALILAGCATMKPSDFTGKEPKLVLEKYFEGKTRAWGIFEDRFGNLKREFVVDIDGTWDGKRLVLDEDFTYADGEKDRRVWRIRKINDSRYEGEADDIIGIARGELSGNALSWRYTMNLKIGSRMIKVAFDDWMFLQPDGVLINRARVKKFGLELGTVTLFFRQIGRDTNGAALNALPPAAE